MAEGEEGFKLLPVCIYLDTDGSSHNEGATGSGSLLHDPPLTKVLTHLEGSERGKESFQYGESGALYATPLVALC